MSNTVIEIVDVVNAAKIMEAAIKRNAFTVEELAQVSPVVAKFIAYSNEQIQKAEEAEKAEAAKPRSSEQDAERGSQLEKGEQSGFGEQTPKGESNE